MADPSQFIEGVLDIAPVPGLKACYALLKLAWDTVQNIQSMKEQLLQLSGTVAHLLQALDTENRAGRWAEDNTVLELRNLESLCEDIATFMKTQASYGILKVVYRHHETVASIEIFHKRIGTIVQAFNITTLLNLEEWQRLNALARENDRESLNERLSCLESNQNQLAEMLNDQHSSVMAMMVSLQKALDKQAAHSISARERKFLSHSLNYLASTSREQMTRIPDWSVTSFEVEFGPIIGSGGFGQVHKGTWNKTRVALKVLKADEGGVPSSACIRTEIQTWSKLRHPHVLQFLRANVFDDRPFIVMPYLKNGNARDHIQTHPSCNRIKILHHVALGLMHLHSEDVIHGDLKALNVLIDDAQNAVLCDFGLSRVKADALSRSTNPGGATPTTVTGSRNWMSPERMLGGSLRKPVDIYAFGMVIWELFTGEVPLGHLPYMDVITLVVQHGVRPERPDPEDYPSYYKEGSSVLTDDLWDLALRCWLKNPKERPDAATLCDEMEKCEESARGHRKSSSTTASTPTPFVIPEGRSRPHSTSLPLPPAGAAPPAINPPRLHYHTLPSESQMTSNSAPSAANGIKASAAEQVRPSLVKFGHMSSGKLVHSLPDAPSANPTTWGSDSTVVAGADSGLVKFNKKARVLHSYTAAIDEPDELTLKKGESIYVLDSSAPWWIAKKMDGRQGIIPSNYVRVVSEATDSATFKSKWNSATNSLFGLQKGFGQHRLNSALPHMPVEMTSPPLTSSPTAMQLSSPGSTDSGQSFNPFSPPESPTSPTHSSKSSSGGFRARAKFSYQPEAGSKHELAFTQDEVLDILDTRETWWIARSLKTGRTEGIVPSNYLQVLSGQIIV